MINIKELTPMQITQIKAMAYFNCSGIECEECPLYMNNVKLDIVCCGSNYAMSIVDAIKQGKGVI